VARKPASVAWEVAGAFPVPALTADQALDAVAPVHGEWLLVNGAGVTGSLVVQLAVARGAIVVATADPSSAARVGAHGAEMVLDYHDPDWPARARGATPGGRGVAAAVNAARDGAVSALQALADGGRLATITGDPPAPERSVSVADVYVQADGPRLSSLVGRLADGELSLRVGLTAPLDQARATLEAVVAGQVPGAAVLVPTSPAS
jgi:NADPH:quinone reductase-like Zn-dependent oxidoreductase